jgi:hypothetical protein
MTRTYDEWLASGPHADMPDAEVISEQSELEMEAESYAWMSHDALVVEVLKLRIRLEAAHDRIGCLECDLGRKS